MTAKSPKPSNPVKDVTKYKNLFDSKLLGLVDREREVRQLMYALFTREHMLLMGPAGTAKSQFAINAFSSIYGSSVFKIHLTKQTTEEYVFGPLNIIELKKGNIQHNTKDSILDVDFAFLDEFFDASDVLLRSLLGVLNERVWMKGSQQVPAKLHTAIVTSNYQRENEVTQAILDRIIFKCDIQPIQTKAKRVKVYKEYLNNPGFLVNKIMTLTDLKDFMIMVEDPKSVTFSKEILETYDYMLEEFMKETKKYISQRTANKALKVLKVSALLNGRDVVEYSDFEELRYVFCVLNRKLEEQLFDAVYEKCVGKAEEERIMMKDVENIETKVMAMPEDFINLSDVEFIDKMRELNSYVPLLETMMSPTDKVREKKDLILSRIKLLVINNQDKLFKRKQLNATNQDPSTQNVQDVDYLGVAKENAEENVPF